MAFPVNLSALAQWVTGAGAIVSKPYIRSGVRFVLAISNTSLDTLTVLRSADPENSGFTTADTLATQTGSDIFCVGSVRVNDVIHIVVATKSSNSLQVRVVEFNMITEQFIGTYELVYTATDRSDTVLSSMIGVESDGTKKIVASGASIKDMGTDYGHLYYSIKPSGGAWTTEIKLGALDNNDYIAATAGMSAADRFHMAYKNDTANNLLIRTLNSADALSSQIQVSTNADSTFNTNCALVNFYDSPERVSFSWKIGTGEVNETNFLDADTPATFSNNLASSGTVNDGSWAMGINGSDKFAAFALSSDDNLYTTKNFTDETLRQTGNITRLYSGIIDVSGTATLAIVYLDAGTLFYTEIALAVVVFQDLQASLIAEANTSNELKPFRGVASSVTALANISSTMDISRDLVASLLAEANIAADLLIGQFENLQANLLAEALIAVNLKLFRNLISPITATANVTDFLRVTKNLDVFLIARALQNSDLSVAAAQNLQASLLAEGSLTSDISVTKNIASSIIALANVTADMKIAADVDLQANLLAESIVEQTGYQIPLTSFSDGNWLSRASPLVGDVDDRYLTISFFFTLQSGPLTRVIRGQHPINSVSIIRTASGRINVILRNASAQIIYSAQTTITFSHTGTVHHFLFSIDTFDINASRIYIDDIDRTDILNTLAFQIIAFNQGTLTVGADNAGADSLQGELGQYWEARVFYDLDVEANRRNFNDGNNNPVDLTGFGSPILYLNNAVPNFEVNLGSGGNFVEEGTLIDGGTYGQKAVPSLSVTRSLIVNLNASADTAADFRILANLASSLLARVSMASDLKILKDMVVVLNTSADVSSFMSLLMNLEWNHAADTDLIANIKVTKNLQSNLDAVVSIFASLGTVGTEELMANLNAVTSVFSNLRPVINLDSQLLAAANQVSDLSKTRDLQINLNAVTDVTANVELLRELAAALFAFGNVSADLRRALLASIIMEAGAAQTLNSSQKMRGQKTMHAATAQMFLDAITRAEQDGLLYEFPFNQDYIELLEGIDVNSPEYQHLLDQIQNATQIIDRLIEQNERLKKLGG